MKKASQRKEIASANNSDSLVYDIAEEQFIQIPSVIDSHLETPVSEVSPETRIHPFIKLVPQLNPDQVFQTLDNMEVINTTGKNIKFVSEHHFKTGVHFIELLNPIDFSNMKIMLLKVSSKGAVKEYPLSLENFKQSESIIIKIDIENKLFSVLTHKINKGKEISIKGSNFRFAIELQSVGNFISVNPCYIYKGQNNTWSLNLKLFDSKYMALVKNWIFLNNFDQAKYEGLEKFLTEKLLTHIKEIPQANEYIHDPDLKVLALKLTGDKIKVVKKELKDVDFVPISVLHNILKMVFEGSVFDGYLQHQAVIDFVTQNSKRFLEKKSTTKLASLVKDVQSLSIPEIRKSYCVKSNTIKTEYLPESDSLLLFNGLNRFKLLKQKSHKGEFIVSPFIFDTAHVNFYLTKEEFQLLFHSFSWSDLVTKLHLTDNEINLLESAFDELKARNSLSTDGKFYFFNLQENHVQILIEKAFEYLNLQINNAYPFDNKEDEIVIEGNSTDEKPEENNQKVDNLDDQGLGDLFNENQDRKSSICAKRSSFKNHFDFLFKNHFEQFPSEFDGFLRTLFKIEEALFLQSTHYRKSHYFANRSHTSFGRLFSYISSTLPLDQISKLVDFGIYINSTFLGQFKHYKQEKYFYNDFNDQNIAGLFLNSYREMKSNPNVSGFPNDNVELDYSISHMSCFGLNSKIERHFSIRNGLFLGIVTDDKRLVLLSTKFGLSKIFETDMKEMVSWTAAKQFENLIHNTSADISETVMEQKVEDPKTAEQAKVTVSKTDEQEKLIDKSMLDALYAMGFSIEVAKKALLDVKSSSLDDAINQIFKMKEEKNKPQEPTKTKVFHLMLKPQWDCKLCTFSNFVDLKNPTPDICEVCGNVADKEAYFEEVEEEKTINPAVEPDQVFKSDVVLDQKDQILDLDFLSLKNENLLHKYFIVLTIRREDKTFLIVSRIAFSEPAIKKMAFQDPKSKHFISSLGFYQLKKGSCDKDLGELIKHLYEPKIINLFTRINEVPLFIETNRKLFEIKMNESVSSTFCNDCSILNERGCESKCIYMVGPTMVQIVSLSNKSKGYCSNAFDIDLIETISIQGVKKIIPMNSGNLAVLTDQTIDKFDSKLTKKGETINISSYSLELYSDAENIVVLQNNNEVMTHRINPKGQQTAKNQLKNTLNCFKKNQKSNDDDDFINPQTMLGYFKTQSNIKFKAKNYENLFESSKYRKSTYNLNLQSVNPALSSKFKIIPELQGEGCNLNTEVFLKVPKNNLSVQNFIVSTVNSSQKTQNTFSNSYQKLELRNVVFKGIGLSKSHHVSQMLVNNGEYFSTKYPFNLFVFESVFEKMMKIKKINFMMADAFKQNSVIDEILVFVFNDLMFLNQFENFKHFSQLNYETALKNGSFTSFSEPCLHLSLKKATSGLISEELEVARFGKYVAFLPIRSDKQSTKNAKNLDCLQYFGVEGNYHSENETELLTTVNNFGLKNAQHLQPFEGYSLQIKHGDKEEKVDKLYLNIVQENKNEYMVKASASVSILSKTLTEIGISLEGQSNDIQMVSASFNLSNISHSLIIKICEQFENGTSEKLVSIFKLYNQKIVEISPKTDLVHEANILSLIDLLLFIIESFGNKSIESILKLNWEKMIENNILNSDEPKVIGATRFLLEKLFAFESSHSFFKKILIGFLENLPQPKLTHDGLRMYWQLIAKFFGFLSHTVKQEILEKVFVHLNKGVAKTKELNLPANKILKTFGFAEIINKLLPFEPEIDEKKTDSSGKQQTLTSHPSKPSPKSDFVDNKSLVDWNGFSFHEKNYAEYYINCTDSIKLQEILIRFPKIKPLLHTTVDVFVFNSQTELFDLVKSKKLNEDFVNYITSRERNDNPTALPYYDLGLNFSGFDEAVKLLKVVFKINHIPVFDYTEPDSTAYEFFIHGLTIEGVLNTQKVSKEEVELIQEGLLKPMIALSNAQFATISDDINSIAGCKGKTRELSSKLIYPPPIEELNQIKLALQNSEKTKKEEEESNESSGELKTGHDDLTTFSEVLDEFLLGIEVNDLKNKPTLISKLSILLSQYKGALDAKRKGIYDLINYQQNLSFWIANLNLAIKEFTQIILNKEQSHYVNQNKKIFGNILVRIFYDSYFFDTSISIKNTEDFLVESFKLFDPSEIKLIIQEIINEYLDSDKVSFVTNIDKLISKIKSVQLQQHFSWLDLLLNVEKNTKLKIEDMTEALFKELILNCSFLNAQIIENPICSQDVFQKIQNVAVWILSNQIETSYKKFEETVQLMVSQVFKSLTPENSANLDMNIDSLKDILVLTAKNGMLPRIDKIIADFVKSISKIQPKTPEAKKYRAFLNSLKLILMSFISENVLETDHESTFGSEKISDILFFALTHIKSIDEIQFILSQEKEEESPKTANTVHSKESISKKQVKTERLNSFSVIQTENDSIFNTFVSDILKYMSVSNIQDNALISIVTNFAINEQINPSLLFSFIKFTMAQSTDTRQTIIYDLGLKFTDIHKKLKANKNKNLSRDFSSSTIELLIELMKNYQALLIEDISLTHFAITITMHIINENEPKIISNEQCKLHLKPQLVAPLFYYTINLLATKFNFGGAENFQNFVDSDINLFELLCNCMHIIVKGIDESNTNLLNFFIQNFKNLRENTTEFDLNVALESLSIWSICNYTSTSPDLKSVIGPGLKKLYADINQLYLEFFKKEEAAKVMLNFICTNFKKLNAILSQKVEKQTLGYQAIYMSENSIEFFETILNYISKNEILANHFLNHNKGLEIIFEILHKNTTESSQGMIDSDSKNSLFAQMKNIANSPVQKSGSIDVAKTSVGPIKDKALFEEEFGTKITNLQIDKAINNGAAVKDWNSNKTGRNSSIFNTSIPSNRKSISLRFKTTEEFELRTFRLSLTVARSENYLIVGPSPYVHLYAIQEDEKKEVRRVYLGELKRINDPGYLMFNSIVYVLNINKLEEKNFISSINNLRHIREMREFEIVIARPLFSVVDKISPLTSRTVSAVNLSINFISIEGFSHNKVEIKSIFRNKIQLSFFKFLEIIFNSESFSESIDTYFDTINSEKKFGIYDLIETQLNPIMQNFEEKMSKFLMTLSEKNKKLADSIFLFLMKNIEKKSTFYFLIERILKKTYSYKYLFEFFDFGKRKLMLDPSNISRFLMVLVNYLSFHIKKLQTEGQEVKFILPIDEKFYRSILNAHKNSPFNYQIERFLVIVIHFLLEGKLYTSFPISMSKTEGYLLDNSQLTQNTKEVAQQYIQLIVDRVDKHEVAYLHLLSYLSLKSQEAKNAIITKKMIETVSQKIAAKDWEISLEILLFIQTCSEIDELYPILLQNSVDKNLVAMLEENIKKKTFIDRPQIINTSLKTIFMLYKKSKEQIADLESILFAMLKRHKNDSFFIEKILLKFFEFEFTKKVSFNLRKQITSDKNASVEDSAKMLLNTKTKSINLQSTGLSAEYLNRLAGQLIFLVDEKTEKTIKNFEWKKILETSDGTEDFSEKFEANMYNKKPSLTVITLDNNGVVGYLGLFVPEGFIKYLDQTEEVAYVPNSDNTFLFWYCEETFAHYKPALDKCDKFLKYSNSESNKSIVFTYDSAEKIILSMLSDYPSCIDLYQMKPIPQDNLPDYEFPYDCVINGIEIFQLDVKADEKSEMINESNNEYLMGKYIEKLGTVNISESLYQESICYELPDRLALKSLKSAFTSIVLPEELKEKVIGDAAYSKLIIDVTKEVPFFTRTNYQDQYNPLFPIFEVFLERGGIQYVLGTIKENENIQSLKEKNTKEVWKQLMDDLLDLQKIDGFLSSMTQNNEFLLIIFELFIDASKSGRNWEDAEFMISNLMFDKLATILKNTDSLDTRFVFFEKNVLRKLLDKLKGLSYENTRIYSEAEVKSDNLVIELTVDKDEPLLKEVKKRKGVGYEKEGTGKKWLVNEYLAKKKLRNEFIVNLLKLFRNLFSQPFEEYLPNDPKVNEIKGSWFRTIAESCLLPMLESAFKCSSLHEMSKEYEVYQQYCEILETVSNNSYLQDLLLQLPLQYKPHQLESLISILKKQEDNTNLFKKFAQNEKFKSSETEDKSQSIELGNVILDTIDKIKKKYPAQFDDEGDEEYENITGKDLENIMLMPVNDQYKIAFKNLRFDLVNFKKADEIVYDHHYSSNITADAKSSSQGRMVRLAQEITDLSSSLPIDSYNSITVRADVNRLDVIKAMIAGAENTPYANGLFEYHVYLPSEYPSGPPKCNLETTGSGDVRFNPNLYSCGKVCLSLLGTWRGSASENWDPKISNLLQLFLSIQSVVMSEEVYFNEPGYEGEAGTEEGEKKNEGYSNIVRLCNIKHSMIKQIKTPVAGFEEVIRRHFYIKRHVILKECGKWVKFAEVRPCSYNGLISDHNHKYASKFTSNNKQYLTELKSAIMDLEKTLKELVANCDPHTIFANKRLFVNKNKSKTKKKKTDHLEVKQEQEKIDTTWDDFKQFEKFDADDKKVADRWSRYIGAMGIEAVKKQSTAKVAVVGLNSLGLEIAKNVVLSGVNTLTLVDWKQIDSTDLLGNFYANSSDIGTNRATCVKGKIQQLNFYVKVEDLVLDDNVIPEFVSSHTVVIIVDNFLPKTGKLLELAKLHKVKVVLAENIGVYSRIFVDFGAEFITTDRDGEDPSECYIKSIDHEKNVITLFEKSFNQLRDGDFIVLSEIETAESQQDVPEINGSIHKIKNMLKVTEIEVEDLSKFGKYQRNGKIKELKVPLKHGFKTYDELSLENHDKFMDENLLVHDFMKMESIPLVSKCFLFKELFEKKHGKEIKVSPLKEWLEILNEEQCKDEKLIKKMTMFWATSRGRIHSLDAFIGGIVSQEAIIGITGKFTPIKQLFCTDIEDILTDEMKNTPECYTEDKINEVLKSGGKYGPLSLIIGGDLLESIKNSNIFMVGAGAIGCELLKNCAMVGIGSGKTGSITLTDPDSIELSNLNRQFLFREKHISKPKSFVAASVVQTMNDDYKDKIVARLEKVGDDTEEIYDDVFIKKQSICLNALDNIKARVYMDQRCVKNHVPLLESGTLGPKGHVQVILPGQTENYSQVRDANEEHNIPVCTLKMFPEEPVHCMEWAKDRFEVLFSQNPKSLIRVLEEFNLKREVSQIDLKIKKTVLKLLKQRPKSIKEAIQMATHFYQKCFVNKIKQLLHVYPLDYKTKEGKLFWTLPKRPPTPKEFSTENPIDIKFIESYSKLLCRIWGIDEKLPAKNDFNKIISEVEIKPFQPKDSEVLKIKKDVEKMEKKTQDVVEEIVAETNNDEEQKLNTELEEILGKLEMISLMKLVKPEVFEKDADSNGHIDFIYSLTSLRSQNYKLAEMDWMSVKLKAGRIVPALATTTATIAALQTLEAIKIIKKNKLDEFKNCFLNLAIPSMTLSEPGPAMKFKIHENLSVTVWDRWEFTFSSKANNKFKNLLEYIESTYKIFVVDVLKDNKPIYLQAIDERKKIENVLLEDILELEVGESCYISVICKLDPKSEKAIQNVPLVKVLFE